MNIKELNEYYRELSGESDDFARKFARLASDIADADKLHAYTKILEEKKCETDKMYRAQFVSFFILCVYYRRKKEFGKFRELINTYSKKFEKESFYYVQKAVCLKCSYSDIYELKEALNMWSTVEDRIIRMPSYTQAYTDTIAVYYEVINDENQVDQSRIEYAISLQERAIEAKHYPKFYYTLAKLYRLHKDFELAKKNVRIAIDKEDSTELDYALRIGEYELLLSKIDMDILFQKKVNSLNIIKNELEDIKKDIEKSKVDNLSFLGFFTGIISFILGSFQIGNDLIYEERIHLLIVLLGCLLIAFSFFKLMIDKSERGVILKSIIIMIASGAIMYVGVTYL